MKKKIFLLPIIVSFLITLACSWSTASTPVATATGAPVNQPNVSITQYSPDYSSQAIVQETATAPLQPEADVQEEVVNPVASPEEVVYTFLTFYDSDPNWMLPYLSQNMLEKMPEGGVMELLGLDGDLEGLVFQAGSSSADPNLAYVEVAIQVNGEQTNRVFTLVRSENGWQIDSIEIKEP